MATRHYSRLLVGTAVLVLIVGLLFVGSSTSSAGKPDRTAPTTPTNLNAGNITDASVALSWKPSTDNSGKWSYKVRVTNLQNSTSNAYAASQSQTTYIAKGLAPNCPYRFSVFAIDGSGNTSADSNVVNATTLPDAP